jgi:hypothetical protein
MFCTVIHDLLAYSHNLRLERVRERWVRTHVTKGLRFLLVLLLLERVRER